MNRIHRLVWNAASGTWQAVCETATASGKNSRTARTARTARMAGALVLMVALASSPHALAGPQGGQVTLGVGNVAQAGATTTITQTSQQLAIDWQSFNVGAGEAVRFVQPGAQAVALNRVLGADPSHILGQLSANGQVFLLNPNGVLFGAHARVDVGGLVASTLSLSNDDLAAGRIQLRGSGSAGAVSNAGRITATEGGYVVLAAPRVHNTGDITTRLGTTALAAGEHVTLQLQGGSLLGYRIERGAFNALAEQAGRVSADGGAILIEAKALDALSSAVVNHSGVSQARTVQERAGRIVLMGDLEVGRTDVAGTLDASAPDGGGGGFVETSAAVVKVADSARVTTRSQAGDHGTWLVDPTDFTIASTGGDISGAALSAALADNNVVLDSVSGAQQGDGSLYVRDEVRWSSNRLTLRAQGNIHLYQDLVGSGSAQLAMAYGLASADGGTSDYHLHNGTRVYLPEGANLSIQKGSAGINQTYQVITQGYAPATAGNVAFTGMNNDTNGFYALGGSVSNVTGSSGNGIINGTFGGQFHGLGHQLVNFRKSLSTSMADEDWSYFVGLFRETGATGVLRDFQMIGGNISLNAANARGPSYVGTVVGVNNGLVHKVYSNAGWYGGLSVHAGGGLVGVNNGTIRQSQFDKGADTSFSTWVSDYASDPGQIAGRNTGLIEDSVGTRWLITGDVSRTDVVAIAGSNTGTINRSYVVNGTHQVVDNNVVRTPTTTEMQQAATFAGWDIDSNSDGNSVWRIVEGQSTPLLRDFRRRVDVQSQLTYNGQTQTDGGISGRDAGFYAAAIDIRPLGQEVTGGLTIDPAVLAVSSSNVNRVYDGTTSATAAWAVVTSGQLFGTDSLSGGSFAFTDRHAGAGKTVTVNGVTVNDGNGGANYTLSLVNNTASTITAAPLSVGSTDVNRSYDGTTDAMAQAVLAAGQLFGTDALTGGNFAFTDRHAGTGKTVTVNGVTVNDGNGGANYDVTLVNNTSSSIVAAALGVSGTDVHRTYDGTTDASAQAVVLTGQLFGTDALTGGNFAFTDRHAGTGKTVTVNGVTVADGNGGANYAMTVANNTTSSIAAAALSVSITDVHRTYDGTTDATGAQTQVVGGQLFGTDILSGGTIAFADRHAGSGKTVTLTGLTLIDGNNGGNYDVTLLDNTTSSIAASPLQIAADAAHKTYDGTTEANTGWQLAGGTLHGTDAIDSVVLTYDNRHVGTGKALGLQGAVVNDGNNGANYALSLVANGASSISPAPLQIAPDAAHKSFDGTTDARTTWRIGSGTVFAGDAVDGVELRYDSADVGVQKRLYLTSVAVNDGNQGANYRVSLADNAASSIALSAVEDARLELAQTAARRQINRVARGNSTTAAPLAVLGCGMRLPMGLARDDCR